MAKKRIIPSQEQCYKIAEWLKANKDMLATKRPEQEKTAKMACAALGFPVSVSTIVSQQKITGVTWKSKRGPGKINTHEIARSCAVFCRDVAEKLEMPLPSKIKDFLDQEAERKKKYAKNRGESDEEPTDG